MLNIVRYPSHILREKSRTIASPTDPSVKKVIFEMIETLRSHEGLGLAAPQVGQNIRLCVIEVEHELFVLINPEIKKLSGKTVYMEEGCLSLPGKYIPVPRWEKIKVSATDLNGKKQVIRARGLLARVIQHEVDHLEGILFIDRTERENVEAPAIKTFDSIKKQ